MKDRWVLYNILLISAFSLLFSWLFGILVIGLAFLPVIFLFIWIFSWSLKKIEASWVVWSIPYLFCSIGFLWFFIGGNSLYFIFEKFWLSLSKWFTPPIALNGKALIFFGIMYVLIYFISKNLKKLSDMSVPLEVASVILGITAQFWNPVIVVGALILFLASLMMGAKYHGSIFSKSIRTFIEVTLLVSLVIFSISLFLTPTSPLGNLFSSSASSKTIQSTNTTVPSKTIVRVPVSAIPKVTSKVPAIPDNGWLYTLVIDTVGIISIIFGAVAIFFMIKYHEKRKGKRDIKKILLVIWFMISALFIFFVVLYGFGLLKPTGKSLTGVEPERLNNVGNNVSVIASMVSAPQKAGSHFSILSDPIFWLVLIALAGFFITFIILELFKYEFTGSREEESKEEERSNFVFEKESYDFKGSPKKTVLFYYRLLRSKIGAPSLTPYEFDELLEKLIGNDDASKLTDIFVKLRYAQIDISDSEADFVRETVLKILTL
jgi:hypothetical protein